jgi:hypothetical protein
MSATAIRTRGRQSNPLRDCLIIEFYQDGNTLFATGKKFGLTAGRVHQIITEHERRHGVVLRRHQGAYSRDRDVQPLIAFYEDGNTLVATGKKYGFCTSRVHQIITEHEQRYGVVVLRHDGSRSVAG